MAIKEVKHIPDHIMRNPIYLILLLHCLSAWGSSTERHYLSGTDSENTKSWDFYCTDGQRSGIKSKIEVPSCWEQQGFGAYTYGRFYKTPGAEPAKESGYYSTAFNIPKSESGKHFRLVFEGAMTDTHVRIDGEDIAPPHQGGFTEFSYDITPYVKPGKKQKLEVRVDKESANASVNSAERRADWWLFGGIYRPVYIEALPTRHISGIRLDARADGHLTARATTRGADESTPFSVGIKGHTAMNVKTHYDNSNGTYTLEADFPGISQWSTESPALHELTLTLGEGEDSHTVTETVGFRTIDFVEGDGFFLNGHKLRVKGTNRHCFHPETGRSVSKRQNEEDIRLLKFMNMNAVRCHYPSDRHFLQLCDSAGILYFDEFPGWQTHYDDTTAMRLLPEFISRDHNHPSVFIWANGNEGGWNTCIDTLFAEYDLQKRKVVHPWSDFNGIDTHHYPAYQTGAYRLAKGRHVFMPTEFLHGQYDKGQGAGLEDFWDNWSRSPLFAGGFIWAFVDEAVRRTDMPTGKSSGRRFGDRGFDIKDCILDSDGPNGPDGCVDPYRQPEGSVYTIREVWSPVYIRSLDVSPGFDGRIPVENRWTFTTLGECSMRYRLLKCHTDSVSCTEEGTVSLPDITPGERGYAHMELPVGFHDNDILEITAYAPEGNAVCTWTDYIRTPEVTDATVRNGNMPKIEVLFTEDGKIERITRNGEIIPLSGGPIPTGMKAECVSRTHHTEADGTEIHTFRYRGGVDSIRWELHPDGRLTMDAVIFNSPDGHGYKGNFITEEGGWQTGFSFLYPEENVDSVRWIGKGPGRVWRNREKGVLHGVWTKAYNNTVTGEYGSAAPPFYPEFKGYHSDVRYLKIFAKDGKGFSVRSDTERMYVRLFTPEEPGNSSFGEMGGPEEALLRAQARKKPEKTMVAFPEGDISFLLSIPPMRSYKPLHQQGPESQPDVIRIKQGDEGFRIGLEFRIEN